MLEAHWIPRDCTKKVSWSGSPAEIEAECETLHAADKKAENNTRVLAAAAIGIGVVGFILGLVLLMLWLSIASLLLAVGLGIAAAAAGADDIEDRKLEIPRTLVKVLADELRPGRPVEVTLDFRGYWRYERGESWLTVTMTLENGVGAQVSMRSTCKRKSRRKRKYTKIKDKIVETLVVRLTPPKGQSLDAGLSVGTPAVRRGALRLKQTKIAPRAATFVYATQTVLRSRLRGGWVDVSAEYMPTGRDVVRAFITSYHLLGHAGARSAGAASAVTAASPSSA